MQPIVIIGAYFALTFVTVSIKLASPVFKG